MLIDEHSDADSRHVQSVQKVLNTVLGLLVHGVRLLQLQNALGHCLHRVGVPIADHHQRFTKPIENKITALVSTIVQSKN